MNAESLRQRHLCGEMRATTESIDTERAAGRHGCADERSVTDDARAQQGSHALIVNPCWELVCERLVDKAEVCISAITVPAGESWRDAQILRATATESATAVGAAEPSDPDPIANRKAACAVADGIDYANNLMTWGDFGMFGGQVALGQV